jgi:WD40 repeat protein
MLGSTSSFALSPFIGGTALANCLVQDCEGRGIASIAVNAEFSQFSIGTNGGEILVCDAKTKKVVSKYIVHDSSVSAMAFSKNSKLLVSVDESNHIIVWDLSKGKPSKQYSGDEIRKLVYHRITAIDFVGPDSNFLVGTRNGSVHLLSTRGGISSSSLVKIAGEGIWSVTGSPSGKVVAASTRKNTIHVWRLATKEKVAKIEAGDNTMGLAISHDDQTLAFGMEKRVRLWDLANNKEMQTLDVEPHVGTVLSFNKKGQLSVGGLQGKKFVILHSMKEKK